MPVRIKGPKLQKEVLSKASYIMRNSTDPKARSQASKVLRSARGGDKAKSKGIKLTQAQVKLVAEHVSNGMQQGKGIGDVLRSLSQTLFPFIKSVGIKAMKEYVLPYLNQKFAGSGFTAGSGLRLAGTSRGSGYGLHPWEYKKRMVY